MTTVTDAILYVVNGAKGCYYAIHETDTGAVLTARTEQEAAKLANDKDMIIVDRREITHTKLLSMTMARGGEATRRSADLNEYLKS